MASSGVRLEHACCDRRTAVRQLGHGLLASYLATAAIQSNGCVFPSATPSADTWVPDRVWGQLGLADGRFQKPRAITIDAQDRIYIVDKTGRIQVFDTDGHFLRVWNTPEIAMGKPTGLGMSRDGLLMVADTHYFRILFYTTDGTWVRDRTIGGLTESGQTRFAFVTDVLQTREGDYYVSEYGEFDRIQKFSAQGELICRFGESGDGPLQFSRPQSLGLDAENQLWITDACNHRIQIVRCDQQKPQLVRIIGQPGNQVGTLRYPYGLWLEANGNAIVAEYGNHRIQRWSADGKSLGVWGSVGKKPGQFQQPWGLVGDSLGRIFVLDTSNERVQRFTPLKS